MILIRHPDAEKEVKATLHTSPHILEKTLHFMSCDPVVGSSCVCHLGDDVMKCRCGRDHESFSYVSAKGIDLDTLGDIIKYIERGECPHLTHARSSTSEAGRNASVCLLDAATIVSNIPVLKMLLKLRMPTVYPYIWTHVWLNILHIAIRHNQLSSLETILAITNRKPNKYRFLRSHQVLFSIIYDRSDYLRLALKKMPERHQAFDGIEMAEIAEFLGNTECLSVLRKCGITFVHRDDNVCLLMMLMRTNTRLFLDMLYFNPLFATCVIGQKSLLKSAIKLDLLNTKLTKSRSRYNGSISVFLLDCGYNLRQDAMALSSYKLLLREDEICSTETNKIRGRIVCRIENELHSPKLLKCCCRDVLRRSFAGKRLHFYLSILKVPVAIERFILMEGVYFQLCTLG